MPKKGGAWTVCRFKGGGGVEGGGGGVGWGWGGGGGGGVGKKEEGGVFERGLYPNANYEQQFFLIYFITTFLKQYSHILK